MSYNMYVCPNCRKVFKITGANKKAKCPKCQVPMLVDIGIIEEAWKAYSSEEKKNIISGLLDEPEIIEVEEKYTHSEPLVSQPKSTNSFFGDVNESGLSMYATHGQENTVNNNTRTKEDNRIKKILKIAIPVASVILVVCIILALLLGKNKRGSDDNTQALLEEDIAENTTEEKMPQESPNIDTSREDNEIKEESGKKDIATLQPGEVVCMQEVEQSDFQYPIYQIYDIMLRIDGSMTLRELKDMVDKSQLALEIDYSSDLEDLVDYTGIEISIKDPSYISETSDEYIDAIERLVCHCHTHAPYDEQDVHRMGDFIIDSIEFNTYYVNYDIIMANSYGPYGICIAGDDRLTYDRVDEFMKERNVDIKYTTVGLELKIFYPIDLPGLQTIGGSTYIKFDSKGNIASWEVDNGY